MSFGEGCLLRIYVGESDKHQGRPLYEWIVRQARDRGLAGATVLRGIEGYGGHHKIHTAKVLDISPDLPLVVEIVDTSEQIEAFLPLLDGAIKGGVATMEKLSMRVYRSD